MVTKIRTLIVTATSITTGKDEQILYVTDVGNHLKAEAVADQIANALVARSVYKLNSSNSVFIIYPAAYSRIHVSIQDMPV